MKKSRKCAKSQTGSSLLELLISMMVFLTIAGSIVGGLATAQKNYRSSEVRVSLEQKVRAAVELVSQEVNEAGLQPSGVDTNGLGLPLSTVTSASCTGTSLTCITANAASGDQWVNVTSVAGIYVGEWLWVDVGPGPNCYPSGYCEQVVVDGISTSPPRIEAKFHQTHTAQTISSVVYPTPLYGMGSYPQGIVPPYLNSNPNSTPPSGGSTTSQLEIFGDLNGTGNALLAVIYACPASFPGAFTRTVYDATTSPANQLSSTNLIDNVTACQFSYPVNSQTVQQSTPQQYLPSGEPIVMSVGLTITAQSTMNDPQTQQPVTVTKSFLNIQPRNVISALNVANSTVANELQTSNPTNLP
jgi:hypothetical protein